LIRYTAVPVLSWFNLPNADATQSSLLLLLLALLFLTCTLLKLLVCIILLGRACMNRMALPPQALTPNNATAFLYQTILMLSQGEEEDNELERFSFARHIVF
jgi:hypothetical protein